MDKQNITGIGRRVFVARERLGMSRAALAKRANVSPAFVSRLEAGHYQSLSSDRLDRLASALGVRPADLTAPPDDRPRRIADELERLAGPDRERVLALVAQAASLPPEARSDALEAATATLRAVGRAAGMPDPDAAPAGWSFRAQLAPHLTPELVDAAETRYGHYPYRGQLAAAEWLVRLAAEIRAERTLKPQGGEHAS